MQAISVSVSVPGGFDRAGAWSRSLSLRPCTGQDEAWLVEHGRRLPLAERVSGLLGRCLGDGPDGVELARRLTLGDREALLLHLRRITVGDRVQWVDRCEACGGPMDIEARASDLVLSAYVHEGWEHAADIDGWHVRFRLPCGADQEAAARADHVAAGVQTLIERCVQEVRREADGVVARLPSVAMPALSAAMAARDPQAELVLQTACPGCARPLSRALDAAQLLEDALADDDDDLFQEVHVLASTYHWSEAEILSLTWRQRRRYLAFIAEGRSEP